MPAGAPTARHRPATVTSEHRSARRAPLPHDAKSIVTRPRSSSTSASAKRRSTDTAMCHSSSNTCPRLNCLSSAMSDLSVGSGHGPGVLSHRRGHLQYVDTCILVFLVVKCQLRHNETVTPRVNTEDLIDAKGVARILGLAQRTSVSVYQGRYRDMPRPVIDMGRGRCKLWQRSAIEAWQRSSARQ